MPNRESIGFRIASGFFSIVVLMAALGWFAAVQVNHVYAIFEEISTHEMRAISHLGKIQNASQKQAVLIRDITSYEDLSIQKTAVKTMKEANAEIDRTMADLNGMASTFDAPVAQLFSDINQLLLAVRPLQQAAISAVQDMEIDVAKDKVYKELRPKQAELNAMLDRAHTTLEKSSHDAVTVAEKMVQRLILIIGLCTAVGAILAASIGWWLTRTIKEPIVHAVAVARTVANGDLRSAIHVRSRDETGQLMLALKDMNEHLSDTVGQIRDGSESIATAANEIAVGNFDLSSRTERQASSLQETATTMEELTATVQQNAENARRAHQLAQEASQAAIDGCVAVAHAVEVMDTINKSSHEIVDIISVIDGIAFQTNILALNAAVIAALAGREGSGFAVVADEVRALAERSSKAARQIAALVGESVSQVESGSTMVHQAGNTIEQLAVSIQRVSEIVGEITTASNQQADGIAQINVAVAELDGVTQQNAALVEQASAAADSLKQQSERLAQLVSVFKVSPVS